MILRNQSKASLMPAKMVKRRGGSCLLESPGLDHRTAYLHRGRDKTLLHDRDVLYPKSNVREGIITKRSHLKTV